MICSKCKKKAVINLRQYRIALCGDCYVKFYLELVKRSVKRYRILRKDEQILACVSGGKDSVAMVYALKMLGYDLEMLFLDLGIGEYSKRSEKVVEEISETLDLGLNVVRLSDYGFTIGGVKVKRVCSICGNAKRYLMNVFARKNGFDVVATGHTSEDVLLFFIKNTLSGGYLYSSKLKPRVEGFDKLVTKAKPIFERTEKENAVLVLTLNLPFTTERCPYAPKDVWKEIIYDIELKKPGFKQNFVRGLVKLAENIKTEDWTFTHCKICGEVSNSDVCSFCKMVMRFSSLKANPY